MNKIFLTLVCGEGSYIDLTELYEPIAPYLNGVCAVCHASPDSMEGKYLEVIKGDGHIVYLPYVGRHDLSRTVAIHCGAIEDGDIVCQFDTLERLSPSFAATIPELMGNMDQVDAFYYYGKILLYRYHESVTFQGTPHEAWRLQGKQHPVCLELSKAYPNEADVRLNVRPQKRPTTHFILHYLSYYVGTPWGANHMILGLDKNGDPSKLFPEREARRLAFRDLLRHRGIPLKAEAVKQYMLDHKGDVDEEFKQFICKEKILNDVWRYYVLGRTDFIDDHDHENVIEIA